MKYKKKKSPKFRGQRSHGYGSHKKHRGAGHRGGRGNAGSGKRADSKKPSLWKAGFKRYGKVGFKIHDKQEIKSINLRTIENKLNTYLNNKLIEQKSGVYVIDLSKLGYDKLLSAGKVTKKFRITALYSSGNAIEKVKQAGGEVTVSNQTAENAKQPEEV